MKRSPVVVTEIISIGNSKGVRIPKTIREQVGLENEVTLTVKDNALVIRPKHKPRAGWDEILKREVRKDDELLFLDGMKNEFDDESWTW